MGRRWGLRHVKSVQSHFRKVGKPIFPKNGEVKFAFYNSADNAVIDNAKDIQIYTFLNKVENVTLDNA